MAIKIEIISHCGFVDHPDLQSLNDCTFVFFALPATILRLWGHVIYRYKGIENIFPMVYDMPP
jgi:hypothetical protein